MEWRVAEEAYDHVVENLPSQLRSASHDLADCPHSVARHFQCHRAEFNFSTSSMLHGRDTASGRLGLGTDLLGSVVDLHVPDCVTYTGV